jgi:hypothetical protein
MRGIRAIAMGIRTHSPAENALFTNRALSLDHRPDPESRTANGRKVPSRVAIGSDSFAEFNPPARQLITECKDRTYRAQSRAVSRPSTSFWCRFEDKVSMSSMQFGGPQSWECRVEDNWCPQLAHLASSLNSRRRLTTRIDMALVPLSYDGFVDRRCGFHPRPSAGGLT